MLSVLALLLLSACADGTAPNRAHYLGRYEAVGLPNSDTTSGAPWLGRPLPASVRWGPEVTDSVRIVSGEVTFNADGRWRAEVVREGAEGDYFWPAQDSGTVDRSAASQCDDRSRPVFCALFLNGSVAPEYPTFVLVVGDTLLMWELVFVRR